MASGHITCSLLNATAVLKHECKYPVKIIPTISHLPLHAAVYQLGYGGGMLPDDCVQIKVLVKQGRYLLIEQVVLLWIIKVCPDLSRYVFGLLEVNVI